MKKLAFGLSLVIALLISCLPESGKKIGNGNILTKTHDVEPFSQLKIYCASSVEIIQSDKELVVIEADENLHEYFSVNSSEESLVVKTKDNIEFKDVKKCTVSIYLKNIEYLKLGNVGSVSCTKPIHSDNITLDISSVGKTHLDINTNKANIEISAVGKVTITGKADSANLNNSSVGKVDMKDFHVNVLDVDNSSVGAIHVFASKEIYINHSGIGSFNYSGTPEVKKLKSSSIGKIKKH